MQAVYLLDQSVNIHTAPNAWRHLCKPRQDDAGEVVEWYIPKDSIVEGDEALLRVGTGQCAPLDEECATACGQSADQLAVTQRRYLAAVRGINGKLDTELFMAGVIEGYAPGTTDDKPVYIPGPNADVLKEIQTEISTTESQI